MTTTTPIAQWFASFKEEHKRVPLPSEIPYYYPAIDTVQGQMITHCGPFQRHVVVDVVSHGTVVDILDSMNQDVVAKWGAYFFTNEDAMALFILNLPR